MAQWGFTNQYKRGTTSIRVIAHVATECFDSITQASLISELMMINLDGNIDVARAMLADLKIRFVGKPYSEWPQPCQQQEI